LGIVIGNLYLNGMRYPFLDVACVYNYAAVGAVRILKFKIKNEIIIGFFTPQSLVLRCCDHTIAHSPDSCRKNSITQIAFEKIYPPWLCGVWMFVISHLSERRTIEKTKNGKKNN